MGRRLMLLPGAHLREPLELEATTDGSGRPLLRLSLGNEGRLLTIAEVQRLVERGGYWLTAVTKPEVPK